MELQNIYLQGMTALIATKYTVHVYCEVFWNVGVRTTEINRK